jgi:hypothetical protein
MTINENDAKYRLTMMISVSTSTLRQLEAAAATTAVHRRENIRAPNVN